MIKLKRYPFVLHGIFAILAAIACAQTQAVIPTPTSAQPTPTAPASLATDAAPALADLLARVSADRLIGDVRALSDIPSRHINNPGVTEAALYIKDQLTQAGDNLQVSDQGFPSSFNGVETFQRNVIATLPGSDPSAGVIVVGAHYDSRSHDITDSVSRAPGAVDNATGTAAVIELARVLAAEAPRATFIFVTFTGEEEGKLGSQYFVDSLSSRPDFRAMISLDLIGMGEGGNTRIYSPGPAGSPSRRLAEFMALHAPEGVPGFVLDVKDAPDRPGRYSDHIPFSDAGYPAARFIQPQEDPSNHSPDDTADHVDPEYVRQVTRVVLAGLYHLGWENTTFTP